MRDEKAIREAMGTLESAAKFARSTCDQESYEVLANVTVALGWVLGQPVSSNAMDELLKGAKWAEGERRAAKGN